MVAPRPPIPCVTCARHPDRPPRRPPPGERLRSDNPPRDPGEALGKVYLANGTAIKPVLRALVASPEFAAAADRKVRDPSQDVVATFRLLGTRLVTPRHRRRLGREPDRAHGRHRRPRTDDLAAARRFARCSTRPGPRPARAMASFDLHWKMAGRLQPKHDITYRAPATGSPPRRSRCATSWTTCPAPCTTAARPRPSSRPAARPSSSPRERSSLPRHPLVVNRMARLLVVFLDHPTHLAR